MNWFDVRKHIVRNIKRIFYYFRLFPSVTPNIGVYYFSIFASLFQSERLEEDTKMFIFFLAGGTDDKADNKAPVTQLRSRKKIRLSLSSNISSLRTIWDSWFSKCMWGPNKVVFPFERKKISSASPHLTPKCRTLSRYRQSLILPFVIWTSNVNIESKRTGCFLHWAPLKS